MPAVPNWSAPTQFDLTNPYNGSMSFNVQTASGIYLLDQSQCQFNITVRSTSDNVPQSDGSILHTRFLTGTQMPLSIQLWETYGTGDDRPACDDLLAEMLDELSGALRSLLNAGDNQGRLAWEIAGGNERMLDDVRLLVYPSYQMGTVGVVTATLDSQYPYAQDLVQQRTNIPAGVPTTIDNTGTATYMPVFQVNRVNGVTNNSSVPAFLLQNLSTGEQFVYSGNALPGGITIPANSYAEITTFSNTIYRNGNLTNLKAGVDELNSEYWGLPTGPNVVVCDVDTDVLWAPAYG